MRSLITTAVAAALVAGAGLAAPAAAASLYALTSDGKLVRVDSDSRRAGRAVRISGAPGPVMAIAVRPADGKLYGLTAGQLVTIDPASGRATAGAKLDKPIETGARAAINFNPTVDRLRVVGIGGSNARVHPDTGAVTADAALKYAPGSPLGSTMPRITAVAYTNHMAGAKETALFTIDPSVSQINLQAPPNDGVQQPKKPLSAGLPNGIGFDIVADGGTNTGYILAGGRLWSLAVPELETKGLGVVGGLPAGEVISLAAMK